MTLDLNTCAVCGERLDVTLVREQYGGACPRCLGAFAMEGSPEAAPPLATPTGGEFGKYVLTDRLGKGGMGEVWKAQDTGLRRTVALKFLHSEDPMELARFQREAHMAASLSHAHIAAIFEVGQIDGRHYLAMQYVPGRSLEKFPKEDRRLMVRLMRDASRAVDHAHRNGVIHRDIKPGNLMVEEIDDDSRIIVLDFGIARAIEGGEKFSMTGDIIGTPAYMSPEQAKGQELDERADVYSLGATLYEILTGHTPFEAANMYDLLKKVEEEEPPAPRRLSPNLDHDLETIVLKCLEKERVRRYDSAKELADDLDRYLNGEAVQAKRANTIYRLKIKLSKRKAVVTAGFAAALLTAVLAWWILVGQPHSEYLRFMAEGRKLWEVARVAAVTGDDPAEIRKKAGAARDQFERAIRAQSDAVSHLMRGRCLALEGDEAGALAALEKAFELDAGNADARVELARSLLLNYVASRGTPLTATHAGGVTPYFGALASERPEERRWRERAERLLDLGETASTQHGLLKGLLAMGREDGYALAAKELAAYTKAERWDSQALMLVAMCEYYVKGFDAAIAALDRSLNLVPRSDGFRWRGLAKQAKGSQDEAIADYTKAIELDPKHARAYLNRGFMKQAKGLLDDAIADYTKAVELDPKDPKARISRGGGKWAKGLVDDAIADFTEAIELDPKNMPAYFNRGTLKQSKRQHDEAIADFTKAIELNSNLPGAYLNRGLSKDAKGLPDDAIADYTKAIELDPKYARAYTNRGLVKQAQGRVDEAIADWEKALEVAPPAWPQRAELRERIRTAGTPRLFQEASKLHELKRYREAIEKFKSIAESHPKTREGVNSAYNIACGYALLGEISNALDWLQKAVEMGFTNVAGIEEDTDLASLRGEERFRRLVGKLKEQ